MTGICGAHSIPRLEVRPGGQISVFPGTFRVDPPYTVVAGFPGGHECVDPQDLETRYALELRIHVHEQHSLTELSDGVLDFDDVSCVNGDISFASHAKGSFILAANLQGPNKLSGDGSLSWQVQVRGHVTYNHNNTDLFSRPSIGAAGRSLQADHSHRTRGGRRGSSS